MRSRELMFVVLLVAHLALVCTAVLQDSEEEDGDDLCDVGEWYSAAVDDGLFEEDLSERQLEIKARIDEMLEEQVDEYSCTELEYFGKVLYGEDDVDEEAEEDGDEGDQTVESEEDEDQEEESVSDELEEDAEQVDGNEQEDSSGVDEGNEQEDSSEVDEGNEQEDSSEVDEGNEQEDSSEVDEGNEQEDSSEVDEGNEQEDSSEVDEGNEQEEGSEVDEGTEDIDEQEGSHTMNDGDATDGTDQVETGGDIDESENDASEAQNAAAEATAENENKDDVDLNSEAKEVDIIETDEDDTYDGDDDDDEGGELGDKEEYQTEENYDDDDAEALEDESDEPSIDADTSDGDEVAETDAVGEGKPSDQEITDSSEVEEAEEIQEDETNGDFVALDTDDNSNDSAATDTVIGKELESAHDHQGVEDDSTHDSDNNIDMEALSDDNDDTDDEDDDNDDDDSSMIQTVADMDNYDSCRYCTPEGPRTSCCGLSLCLFLSYAENQCPLGSENWGQGVREEKPRTQVDSPVKDSIKTRVMDHVASEFDQMLPEKLQTLEMQILRLENTILMEKLSSNKGTGDLAHVTNMILKLENELLRLNASFNGIQSENIKLQQNQMTQADDLELVKEKTDYPVSDNSIAELIRSHQVKIDSLGQIVQSHMVDMTRMEEKTRRLEEDNRALVDRMLTQSMMMNDLMSKLENISSEQRHQREAIVDIGTHVEHSKYFHTELELDRMTDSRAAKLGPRIEADYKVEGSAGTQVDSPASVHNTESKTPDATNHLSEEVATKIPDYNKKEELDHQADPSGSVRKTNMKSEILDNVGDNDNAEDSGKKDITGDVSLSELKNEEESGKTPVTEAQSTKPEKLRKQEKKGKGKKQTGGTKKGKSKKGSKKGAKKGSKVTGKDTDTSGKPDEMKSNDKDTVVKKQETQVKDAVAKKDATKDGHIPISSADSDQPINKADLSEKAVQSEKAPKEKGKIKQNTTATKAKSDSTKGKKAATKKLEAVPAQKVDEKVDNMKISTKESKDENKANSKTKTKKVEDTMVTTKKKISKDKAEKAKSKKGKGGKSVSGKAAKDGKKKPISKGKKVIKTNVDSHGGQKAEDTQKKDEAIMKKAQKKEEEARKKEEEARKKEEEARKKEEAQKKAEETRQREEKARKEAEEEARRKEEESLYTPNGKLKPRYYDQRFRGQKDCYDHFKNGRKRDMPMQIQPVATDNTLNVFCDMKNGGWTIIQRRMDGSQDFFRDWAQYKKGFGGISGEHWIGNDNLHYLTNQGNYTLRIDMMDWERKKSYAEYELFSVDDEAEGYRLHVSGYSGDAGDSLLKHDGHKFSTKDVDNDLVVEEFGGSCATRFTSAWWFYKCFKSNLNGKYYKGGHIPDKLFDGVTWKSWTGSSTSLKRVEMKIKPKLD